MYYPVWEGAYKRSLAVNQKEKPKGGISSLAIIVVFYHMFDAI